ncbi:Phosphocholine transferase AnkX [Armadillidium vulgare]|nr:Phosphocholine transferase AnkX [Armadillidium vulgare] [Wolbachia endosymbiont of Armadillidium vulgare]
MIKLKSFFLEKKVNIDDIKKDNNTLLSWAIWGERFEAAKLLIDEGASFDQISKNVRTMLGFARGRKYFDIVEYSKEKHEEEKQKPVQRKHRHFHGDHNHQLLAIDLSNQRKITTSSAVRWIDADVHTRDSHGETPLHSAARYGKPDEVNYLIGKSVYISSKNGDGKTPFEVALELNRMEIANLLAIVKDKYGYTALHYAEREGNLNLAKLLFKNGASIYAKNNDGWTPVQLAAKYNNLDMVKFHIEKIIEKNSNIEERNSKINAKNNYGWTVLHYAYAFGTPDMVNFLISNGADARARTNLGKTFLEVAREYGNLEVVNFCERDGESAQRHKRQGGSIVQKLSLGSIANQKLEELNSKALDELLGQFKCLVHQQPDSLRHNKYILQHILQESKGVELLVWLIVREYSILSLEYSNRTNHSLLKGLDEYFNTVINKRLVVRLVKLLEHDDVVPRVERFIRKHKVELKGKIFRSSQQRSRRSIEDDNSAIESTRGTNKLSSWVNVFADTLVGAVKSISQFISSPFN